MKFIEDDWADIPFDSAEIEELEAAFKRVLNNEDDPNGPIKLDLSFPRPQAASFIETVQRAPHHPMYANELLRFCQYLAGVVEQKLGGGT